jgi:flagellar export protein FliJ
MHSFRFRLQSLLDLRRRQTEAEEARLSELMAGRIRLENRRSELRSSDREARESLARDIAPSAARREAVARFNSYAVEACLAIARQLQEQDGRIEAQRKVVQERRRNEELLESLRQEDQAAWIRAMELELEGLAADSFIAAWNRRRNAARRLPVRKS